MPEQAPFQLQQRALFSGELSGFHPAALPKASGPFAWKSRVPEEREHGRTLRPEAVRGWFIPSSRPLAGAAHRPEHPSKPTQACPGTPHCWAMGISGPASATAKSSAPRRVPSETRGHKALRRGPGEVCPGEVRKSYRWLHWSHWFALIKQAHLSWKWCLARRLSKQDLTPSSTLIALICRFIES